MNRHRIGLVDYRLDNFHAEVYLAALRGPLADRGYDVVGATALEREPSVSWAREKALPYFDTVETLAEQSDFFAVLAPSNPEVHLQLCQSVFPCGKPTFVDKTFAPDLRTAEEIFRLADKYGIAVQSTSALRSSAIQAELARREATLQVMFITSSGPSFDEYGIHPVEIAVSCLGPEIEGLIRLGTDDHPRFVLNFSGQRTAIIDFNQRADVPFAATLVDDQGYQHVEVDAERLFTDAASSILDFFDRRAPAINRRETLAVRRILDVAMQEDGYGKWIHLTDLPTEPTSVPAPHWQAKKATPS